MSLVRCGLQGSLLISDYTNDKSQGEIRVDVSSWR